MTVLACDLGGRRIKLGIVRDEQIIAQAVISAQADQPLARRLPALASSLRELCRNQQIDLAQCEALVWGYPSIVDSRRAKILDHFDKYGDAAGLDLRAWAREELQLPLLLENDARLALIGEWQCGAARGFDNVVMMTLGTGLGAAAVVQGRPLRGEHGQAGILGGHFTIQVGGRRCVCGNIGCAEAEASTSVLAELLGSAPGGAASPLARVDSIGYEDVLRYAADGDPAAISVRDRSFQVWGTMAVNLIHAYDPEILVIGGGVMASRDVILPAISSYVSHRAHVAWGSVSVVASVLGDRAALLGAPWCVKERVSYGV